MRRIFGRMGAIAVVPVQFRLKELLKKQKPAMSQSELSRRSGVSMTTINAMVLNKTRQVSLDTLDKIADALDVEPGELLERDKNRRRR